MGETFDGQLAIKYATALEVCRYIHEHPGVALRDIPVVFGHSKTWLMALRKDEVWERAYFAAGRERWSSMVPLAMEEVEKALKRGDPTATATALKILENVGMLRPEEEITGPVFPTIHMTLATTPPVEPEEPVLPPIEISIAPALEHIPDPED